MGIIFYLLSSLLYIFDLFLLARAVCSWFETARNSKIYELSYTVTEPVLRPIRDMLSRFEWVRRCPIDISFIVVILMVNALSSTFTYLAGIF